MLVKDLILVVSIKLSFWKIKNFNIVSEKFKLEMISENFEVQLEVPQSPNKKIVPENFEV